MTRFVCIAPDGETTLAVLQMNEADALLNVPSGGSIVAISNDNGAVIRAGSVRLVGGAFVDASTSEPVESLAELILTAL